MSEAETIADAIEAAGRLHTRIDTLGSVCAGTLRSGMRDVLDNAASATIRDLDALAGLARSALETGTPTSTQSETLQTLRGQIDQSLARIDAVLFDIVSAAE
jgi:hypothetical protein